MFWWKILNPSKKVELNHFGCSSSVFDEPYLALAAGVGMQESEIDKLIAKLTDIFSKIKNEKWYLWVVCRGDQMGLFHLV